MLPVTVQFIVAMLAYALNERMARKAEDLQPAQGVADLGVAPPRIFSGHTEDKLSDLARLPRPAWPSDLGAIILSGDELFEPGEDRGRPANLAALLALRGRECLAFGRQTSPLLVGERDPDLTDRSPDRLLEHPVLFAEIFGEHHLRHLLHEFCAHYHKERYHQGLGSKLVRAPASTSNDNATTSDIQCRSRLGGLLNFYYREAA